MKTLQLFFLLFFTGCYQFNFAQTSASRIGNSPYPVSVIPDTLALVNVDGFSNSQQLTTVTLQGVLAKTKPRIMLQRGAALYLSDLLQRYNVVYDSTYLNDFTGLINHFKNNITGYLLCGMNDTSSNAAISASGILNSIAVTVADTAAINSLGIPMLNDIRAKGQSWAWDSFPNSYSHSVLSFQSADKCTYLSDYSIFAHAFHYSDITFVPLSNNAFGNIRTNGALFGWGNEYTLTYTASSHNMYLHASDWSSNLSTWSNFEAPVQQKNHSADTAIIPGTHTVCFVMTDGDNIQWVSGDFASSHSWYGSPNRGVCNIGWTISPALAELAPTMMKYLYDTAANTSAGKDYFIAAPSGIGYFYPETFPLLDSAAAITSRMMQKADLSIVNLIGNTYDDSLMKAYVQYPNIEGVFYYTYASGYYGLHGFATCVNGKPVISARYSLWNDEKSVVDLANAINALPKDPHSTDGYTLVDVHVWDKSVDSIIRCVSLLDSNVRVVLPDAFVKLFKAGINCAVTPVQDISGNNKVRLSNTPNPCSEQTEISFYTETETPVQLILYDNTGKQIRNLFSGTCNGKKTIKLNTGDLANGIYLYTLSGTGFSETRKCVVQK